MIADPMDTTEQVKITHRRFTVAEFLRLADIGFLREDERVELIRGEIVEISPFNVPHASTVSRLLSVLSNLLGHRVILSIQNPVQLDDETLLQPDVALLKTRDDFYSKQHPGPDDLFLVIEVSDSTVSYDRRVKASLYSTAGIIEYWIVNLPDRQIEVYREPQPDGYRMTIRYTAGESLSCLAFSDIMLKVDNIIGATIE